MKKLELSAIQSGLLVRNISRLYFEVSSVMRVTRPVAKLERMLS